MNEGNRFVVEIVGQLQETREVTVSRVCDALGLDETRAAALVARMPGIITRPAGEDRAMKIAMRLQEAGLTALHRPLAEGEDPFRARERPAEVAVGRPKLAPDVAPPPAVEQGHAIDPRPAAGAPVAEPGAEAPAAEHAVEQPSAPDGEEPEASVELHPPELETDGETSPRDIPSLDATHHDFEPDPKLTPMSEAGFGAADIVLPTKTAEERPRARSTFVEAGSTSFPTPDDEDPTQTMVRAATEVPTPHPDLPPAAPADRPERAATDTPVPELAGEASEPRPTEPTERPLTPVSPVLSLARGDAGAEDAASAATPRPDASGVAPKYRQTRSSAEPALTLSAPPEEVLKRSGIPDAELGSGRRRGRFGRHLAAQVALPGLLTWSLTAVALWWFLGADRTELFVVLAAASALAALMGSLIAALGTMGLAQDVVRLRDEARRVAMGDLTAPVASNRDDELGEVAGSLERMRLSLQEGMERLRQRRR
jgi:HAMP domain-containing protein